MLFINAIILNIFYLIIKGNPLSGYGRFSTSRKMAHYAVRNAATSSAHHKNISKEYGTGTGYGHI